MDGTGDLFKPLLAAIGDSISTVVVRYPTAEALDYPALTQLARASLPLDRPFVILGESFSGPIAVAIASEAPPGMVGFILCASFVSRSRPWFVLLTRLFGVVPIRLAVGLIGARRLMGRFQTPALRQLLRDALETVSPAVLRTRARAALNVDISYKLAAAKMAALYIQGTEDSIVPKSAAETFARLAAHGKVAKVIGPHFVLQCAPEQAARAIGDFVTGLQNL
jgi:pimeloyl-ACP methyl ester carboxylesterase